MITTEERRSRRISYQAPVGALLIGNEQGEQRVLSMLSRNLSCEGMLACAADAPGIGSELLCNLATEGGSSAIQLLGRVAWSSRDGDVGIEFVDMSAEQTGALKSLVAGDSDVFLGESTIDLTEQMLAIEYADTMKTAVEDALDGSSEDMLALQSVDEIDEACEYAAIDIEISTEVELPKEAPVFRQDKEGEAKADAVVQSEVSTDETLRIQRRGGGARQWLLTAAIGGLGALALATGGFGLFSAGEIETAVSSARDAKAVAKDAQRQRVLALVAPEIAQQSQSPKERALERIRAAALSANVDEDLVPDGYERATAAEVSTNVDVPIPAISKKAEPFSSAHLTPKITTPAQEPTREVLGGISIRESDESLVIRLPITGTDERAVHYVMNEPAAIAVNMPYAQPTKGYSQSLYPTSASVRLIWLRERLGGLHLRIFFRDARPLCKITMGTEALEIRCQLKSGGSDF